MPTQLMLPLIWGMIALGALGFLQLAASVFSPGRPKQVRRREIAWGVALVVFIAAVWAIAAVSGHVAVGAPDSLPGY